MGPHVRARSHIASPGRFAAGGWCDRAGALAATFSIALWVQAVLLGEGTQISGNTEREGPHNEIKAGVGTAETLVAAYVGWPYTHASDLRFAKPGATDLTVHDVQWEGRPFKSPIYYGLRAVRWGASAPFGAMLDFTHSKAIAVREQQVQLSGERNGRQETGSAKLADRFRHLEFSHGHNMLTLNALWRPWPAWGLVVPYGGAGGGVNLPHTEVQFSDEPDRTYEYQYTGPVGQVLAGIEIRLPHASLFVEYKFTLARYVAPLTGRDSRLSYGPDDFWVQLAAWWRGEQPKYGTVTTTLASHQLIGGLGYRKSALPGSGG